MIKNKKLRTTRQDAMLNLMKAQKTGDKKKIKESLKLLEECLQMSRLYQLEYTIQMTNEARELIR